MIDTIRLSFCAAVAMLFASCSSGVCDHTSETAPVWPDYDDATVPVNIAPLNISSENGEAISVFIKDSEGTTVLSGGGTGSACFGIARWHKVLRANIGKDLFFDVRIKEDGRWNRYAPIVIHISRDVIDDGLTYRLIPPGYQVYGKMGIYERRLSSFRQRTLLDNRMIDAACINCHTSKRTSATQYTFHVRGVHSATVLSTGGNFEYLNTGTGRTSGSFVYPSWHPSGKFIAYSINKTRQEFYNAHHRRIEVYDESSDIIIYNPVSHTVECPDALNSKESFETFPAYSAGGDTLFFCTAAAAPMPDDIANLRYSLCSYCDGKVDTLVNSQIFGRSVSFPRPSYDGRYIMTTVSDFGTFPIWHREADLWIYNLKTGTFRPIDEVNSSDTESFHNWDSSSRWFVFSSRRGDGLYTRLYIAHISADGTIGKPFILPQKDPKKYYGSLMMSYNTPDFASGKVKYRFRKMSGAINSPDRTKIK